MDPILRQKPHWSPRSPRSPRRLQRTVSSNKPDQNDKDTCYIHVIAKILTRFAVVECDLFDDFNSDESAVVVSEDRSVIEEYDHDLAQAQCNFIFDDSVSHDLLWFLMKLETNATYSIFCDKKTILVGILYRIIFRILYVNDEPEQGGFFEEIKYVFEQFEYLSDLTHFNELFETPTEAYFSKHFLPLKKKSLEQSLKRVLKRSDATSEPFKRLSKSLENVETKLEGIEFVHDNELIQEQLELFTKYRKYIERVYDAIVKISHFWKNNELVVVKMTASELRHDFAIQILKQVLNYNLYIGVNVVDIKNSDGHAMTIVGFEEGSYLIKNSWGDDNSYESIVVDGKMPSIILEEAPINTTELDMYVNYYHERVTSVNFILTAKLLMHIDPENMLSSIKTIYIANPSRSNNFKMLSVPSLKDRNSYKVEDTDEDEVEDTDEDEVADTDEYEEGEISEKSKRRRSKTGTIKTITRKRNKPNKPNGTNGGAKKTKKLTKKIFRIYHNIWKKKKTSP